MKKLNFELGAGDATIILRGDNMKDAGDAREGIPREASPSSNRNILGELEANLGKLERQDPRNI